MILFIFLLCLVLQSSQLSCSNPPIFIPFQSPTCFTEATYDTEDLFNNNTINLVPSFGTSVCQSQVTSFAGIMASTVDFEQRLIEMNTTKYTLIFPFRTEFLSFETKLEIKIGTTLHIEVILKPEEILTEVPAQYSIRMIIPATPLMVMISPIEATKNYIHVIIDGTSVSATVTKFDPVIVTNTTSGTLASPISGALTYVATDTFLFLNHQVHDRLLSQSEIVDFGTTTFLDFSSFGISNFKCSAALCLESGVCSGHGDCFGPDQCACDIGYTGSNCELNTCFGIISTDCGNVCSGHGSCTSPDVCTCEIGYEGSSCELFSCTGLLFNNTEVCSEHGSCIESDICDCDGIDVYFGDNCENVIPNCTNVTIALNECLNRTCPAICFDIGVNSSQVCSGHGDCVGQDSCECSDPCYTGDDCGTFNCISGNCSCTMFPMWSQNIEATKTDDTTCVDDNYPWTDVPLNNLEAFTTPGTIFYNNNWTQRDANLDSNTIFLSWELTSETNRDFGSTPLSCSAFNQMRWNFGDGVVNVPVQETPSVLIAFNIDHNVTCMGGNCVLNNDVITSIFLIVTHEGTAIDLSGIFDLDPIGELTLRNYENGTSTITVSGQTIVLDSTFGNITGIPQTNIQTVGFVFGCISQNTNENFTNAKLAPIKYGISDRILSGEEIESFIGGNLAHTCFGLSCNNTQVCAGHGVCDGPDICECLEGFFGDNCASTENITCPDPILCEPTNSTCDICPPIISCFGENATTNNVCSSHGRCTSQDVCICSDGYSGLECDTPICVMPCQNNGTCTAPDVCTCTSEYQGAQCQNPICTLCSPFTGTCTSPNICTCDLGYSGVSCTIPLCPSCVHVDTCFAPDMCTCGPGWHGPLCDIPECDGIRADDDDVCLGRGTCIGIDNCTCDEGYSGEECELFDCFGTSSLDSEVCSGNGKCVDVDSCKCTTNGVHYSGEQCEFNVTSTIETLINETTILEGLLEDCEDKIVNLTQEVGVCNTELGDCEDEILLLNTTLQFFLFPICNPVCQNGGSCAYTGFENITQCNCAPGWEGDVCEISICQHTCVNGNCIAPGTCSCNSGWSGNDCDIPLCPSGCVNGNCGAPSTCTCDSGFSGVDCNTPICTNPCQNGGSCVAPDSCTCMDPWFGALCDNQTSCPSIPIPVTCFGIDLTNITICGGFGTCIAEDTCVCDIYHSGTTCDTPLCNPSCTSHGVCTDVNQCTCDDDFTGALCEIPICTNCVNGQCLAGVPNICSCTVEYENENCTQAICPSGCVHGDCTDPGVCTCDADHHGADCSDPQCDGVDSGLDDVCSSHGTCTAVDTCVCDTGYFGTFCEEFNCDGLPSTDGGVCNAHGLCLTPDMCKCNFGYDGFNCSINTGGTLEECITIINELGDQLIDCQNTTCTKTCNHGGLCVFDDDNIERCDCVNGWIGEQCDTSTCQHNCNHGLCSTTTPGLCICDLGWLGDDCNVPQCVSPCANGACTAPNTCLCKGGWSGVLCDIPICVDPCQNGGSCTSPNICTCVDDFYGSVCENNTICDVEPIHTCFGILETNMTVCSGHGSCEDQDICACDAGFVAPLCEKEAVCSNGTGFICFDIPSENDDGSHGSKGTSQGSSSQGSSSHGPKVCGGHGVCVGNDLCACDIGYMPPDCTELVTPDDNITCFAIPADSDEDKDDDDQSKSTHRYHKRGKRKRKKNGRDKKGNKVCNGNGVCVQMDTCMCDDGYVPPACLKRVPTCFGYSALNIEHVCGGRGTCIAEDLCHCGQFYFGQECGCHNEFGPPMIAVCDP